MIGKNRQLAVTVLWTSGMKKIPADLGICRINTGKNFNNLSNYSINRGE